MIIAVFIISYLYALLHLGVGLIQLRQRQVPARTAVLFIAGALSIALTSFFWGHTLTAAVLLSFGFILIQSGAIMNGIHLHGKVTASHQLVRLALFAVLLVIFLLFS
ncbi:hypothetical protein [Paenibacillus sp. IHBB 3054]|uniref:hypothetical protein n=1 Tax=Paenibacillus sp. IHBB 3054 TaxID=3425689 RepID=UPI003F666358